MANPYKVLLFGASYGSLLAIKLVAAGHTAKLVCMPAEGEAFNSDGQQIVVSADGSLIGWSNGSGGMSDVHSNTKDAFWGILYDHHVAGVFSS